jgi:hypothetical protein
MFELAEHTVSFFPRSTHAGPLPLAPRLYAADKIRIRIRMRLRLPSKVPTRQRHSDACIVNLDVCEKTPLLQTMVP